MKQLFKISVLDNTPELKIDPIVNYASEFDKLDGEPKARISPADPFLVVETSKFPWQQVLAFAPGGFALSEEAWEECDDMYHILKMGSELLTAKGGKTYYIIINPLDFAPLSNDPRYPYRMESFSAPVFRLRDKDPTELFCLSGTEIPDAEFKRCYEKFGFTGLSFEEVWRGD